MEQMKIELWRLHFAVGDDAVRKGNALEGIKGLKENIRRFGLLVPLLVKPHAGKETEFTVVDGNRRLAALNDMGDDPARLVECVVGTEAEVGAGQALSANMMRMAMNPMDQYDVFAQLITEGVKPKEIAELFDVPVKRVGQVLALASLAPPIKDKVRSGELSWGTAEALTMIGDHKVQLDLLEKHGDHVWQIRGALEENSPRLATAIFERERYFVEGGQLLKDLFTEVNEDDHLEELCADGEIFWRLQHQAIEEALNGFRNQGWKAVMEYDQTMWGHHSWPKRSEIKSKKLRKIHSVIYQIDDDGAFKIWDTVMPEPEAVKEAKVEAAAVKRVEAEAEKVEVEMTGNRPMSSHLVHDLKQARSRQVKAALAANPRLAAKVMVMMLSMADYRRGYSPKAGMIQWSEAKLEEGSLDEFPLWLAFDREYMALRDRPTGEMWNALVNAGFEELAERVGHIAARIFDAQSPGSDTMAKAILATEPVHGRAVWTPNEYFWQACGRAYMLQVLAQITSEAVASRYKNEKVAELAKRMARWFTMGGDEKLSWLQFGGKDEPVPESVRVAFRDWTPAILALPPQREPAEVIFQDNFDNLDSEFEEEEKAEREADAANENTADAAE